MFSVLAHAQEVVAPVVAAPVVQDVSVVDFISLLFQSLGGLKGAGALGAAGILVQLLIAFLKTPLAKYFFSNLSGGMKLVLVTGLSLVAGVIALLVSGVAVPAALIHASTLASVSVFSHQIYKQFFEKKVEEKK